MRALVRTAAVALVAASAMSPGLAEAAGRCGDHAWCDTSLSADRRADLLLAQLTLDERLDLMGGDDMFGFVTRGSRTGTVNGIPRLDVPPLYLQDGPAGIRDGIGPNAGRATALPLPVSLGATFDTASAALYARVVAAEARRRGSDVMLGPTVDVTRDPRAGRTFESFGEDPALAGELGAAYVRSMQSRGVIATAKHLAGNTQETNRTKVDHLIDERTLREIYLPPFESVTRRGGVGSVMTSYNRINGPYAGASRPLVRGTLFGDFGFRGYVVSDWGAGGDTVASVLAGQSLVMPVPQYYEPAALRTALADGRLRQSDVDDLVRRYLRTMFRFGVFDRGAYPRNARLPSRRHGRVARRLAERGAVLLRNRRSLLPLSASRLDSVAVLGASAAEYVRPGRVSSAGVNPLYEVTALDGIRRAGRGRFAVRYDDGSEPDRAARVARRADVAVVAVSPSFESGEFDDLPCLALDCRGAEGDQVALIRAVARANPRTVVVVQSPGPVTMPWARRTGAILEAWWPGQEGGNAIARILFGKVNPSGRLPLSFPRSEADLAARTPAQYPGVGGRVTYSEGVLTGYRHHDARGLRPLYPFGHGLSYTSFHYRDLSVRAAGRRYRVTLRVSNMGARAGAEVVQLYLGLPRPARGVPQPPKALKRFRRVQIPAGRSRDLTFTLNQRDLSYWDVETDRWRVAPGCYRILVGSSSRDIRLRDTVAQRGAGCARPRS